MDKGILPSFAERAPQSLAVDGHDFPVCELRHRERPPTERFTQGLRVKSSKHSSQGIVCRNALVQAQECAQPFLPGAAEGLDRAERVSPTNNSA